VGEEKRCNTCGLRDCAHRGAPTCYSMIFPGNEPRSGLLPGSPVARSVRRGLVACTRICTQDASRRRPAQRKPHQLLRRLWRGPQAPGWRRYQIAPHRRLLTRSGAPDTLPLLPEFSLPWSARSSVTRIGRTAPAAWPIHAAQPPSWRGAGLGGYPSVPGDKGSLRRTLNV
jgi:hypothetical protein